MSIQIVLMRINDDTAHELASHHWVDAILLHVFALWSLRHLVWHRRYLQHLMVRLTLEQMTLFTVNLHLWLIGRFCLITFFDLILVKLVLLGLKWLHATLLIRHVETSLRCFIRIRYVLVVEMVIGRIELILEKTSWLIHWKVDVSIIKQIINHTRISDHTTVSNILVALAWNLMRLSISTVWPMMLKRHMVVVVFDNLLTMVHVRHRWDYKRLRTV